MRMVLLLSVLAISVFCRSGDEIRGPLKVFWIPPEVETDPPITPGTIETAAFKIVQIIDGNQGERIVRLIQKSTQAPDTKMTRIKISLGDKSYTFDASGIGVSSTGEHVGINVQKLKQVLCE